MLLSEQISISQKCTVMISINLGHKKEAHRHFGLKN